MSRVYYDRHGRHVGYSLPLWLVALKWALIVGLIVWPVYAACDALGIPHAVTSILALAWLIVVLAAGVAASRAARR